jgi:hypothetical protein
MVRASTFLLNFVRASTFLLIFFLWDLFPLGSCCSRSECEKRKAIWDACIAEIAQDPGQKKDFDTQMLAVVEQMGQYTQSD